MKSIPIEEMSLFPDPATDERLLPSFMLHNTNDEEIYHLKIASRIAIEQFLTEDQREVIYKHYWQGMSKTAIGASLGISASAVCKRLRCAHETIRNLAEYCLEVQKLVKSQLNTGDIS